MDHEAHEGHEGNPTGARGIWDTRWPGGPGFAGPRCERDPRPDKTAQDLGFRFALFFQNETRGQTSCRSRVSLTPPRRRRRPPGQRSLRVLRELRGSALLAREV